MKNITIFSIMPLLTLLCFVPKAIANTTTLAGGLYAPAGIATHDGYVYFTEVMCANSGAGTIKRVSFNGGPIATLASGLAFPFGIVADDTHIYFSQNSIENGAIRKIPIAGGPIFDLATGLDVPNFITKDNNYIYWGEGRTGIPGTIKKVPLTGGAVSVLASDLSESPFMVALDNNYVYWIDNGNLYKISKEGGQSTILVNGLKGLGTVAVDSEFVYWSESGTGQNDGSIKKVSTSGGTSTTLVSGLNSIACIAIDNSYLYWVEGFELNSNKTTGALKKVSLTGGTIESLSIGLNSSLSLIVDNDFIYWAEGTFISDSGCPIWPPQNGTIRKLRKTITVGDVTGDGRISLEDAIHALQIVSGVRPGNDVDDDGDGYTETQGDCDDTDSDINPGAAEICNDLKDNDCDGQIDQADSDCVSGCIDNDGDGYGVGTGCLGPDCDDDPAMGMYANPGMSEIYNDGIDNDCDGQVDEGIQAGVPLTEDFTAWQSDDESTSSGGGRWYCNATLPVTGDGVLTDWELFIDSGGAAGEVAQIAVIRCVSGSGGTGPALADCIRVGIGPIQSIAGNGLNTFSLAGSVQLDGAISDPTGIVIQAGDWICTDSNDYDIGGDCNGSALTGGCPGQDLDTQYVVDLDIVGEPFNLSDSTLDGTLMIRAWGPDQ